MSIKKINAPVFETSDHQVFLDFTKARIHEGKHLLKCMFEQEFNTELGQKVFDFVYENHEEIMAAMRHFEPMDVDELKVQASQYDSKEKPKPPPAREQPKPGKPSLKDYELMEKG